MRQWWLDTRGMDLSLGHLYQPKSLYKSFYLYVSRDWNYAYKSFANFE